MSTSTRYARQNLIDNNVVTEVYSTRGTNRFLMVRIAPNAPIGFVSIHWRRTPNAYQVFVGNEGSDGNYGLLTPQMICCEATSGIPARGEVVCWCGYAQDEAMNSWEQAGNARDTGGRFIGIKQAPGARQQNYFISEIFAYDPGSLGNHPTNSYRIAGGANYQELPPAPAPPPPNRG
jgi:hypothetical protein